MKINKKKHRVIWEKFENPYQPPEEEDEEEYVDSYEKEGQVQQMHPVVLTPQGPVGIYNLSDVMNFWIGYTDFIITKPIIKLIDKTSGVESLEVFTPYRMRISIGKLFKPNVVMSSIGESINKSLYGSKNG